MVDVLLAIFFILLTVFAYIVGRKFYEKITYPFTIPILIGTTMIITFLLIFKIPYETYELGGKWIEMLLGPAVVALAYPLYNQIGLLKKYFIPIVVGVTTGALVGLFSGFYLAKWFKMEDIYVYSILPKSVTTPVAMDIAKTLGGIPPLAAIFVMVAGITGVVLSPYLYYWFRFNHILGRGIGIGSASHALGTSSALQNSEEEGAISTVAMILSAILVSLISPIFLML